MSDLPRAQLKPDELERILASFKAIEDQLQAPRGSLALLGFNDDWSVVIKSHAMVEGMVTLMLISATDERLSPAFAVLPFGEPQAGKLVFAKLLGLIDVEQQKFARRLLELRNDVAHDPKSLGFTFTGYLAGMDKNRRTQFAKEIQILIPEADRKAAAEILAPDQVKHHVVAAVMRFLRTGVVTALTHKLAKVEAMEAKDKAAILDDVIANFDKLLAEFPEQKLPPGEPSP